MKDAGGFAHIRAANLKMSSKSYRAILPPLSDDELLRLRAWSEEHCATSALFRDGGAGGASCVVWLATKERPRPREAFMRSIRGTLKRLGIDTSRMRGTWLALTESNIVLQESRAARAECPVAAGPSTTVGIAQQGALLPKPSNKAPSSSQVPQEDSDEKIIHLSGSARRTACSGIQVVKV